MIRKPGNDRRSVCFITQTSGFGGVELHTLKLMEMLIDRGYQIELIECLHDKYDRFIADRGWEDCVFRYHVDIRVTDSGRKWRKILGSIRSSTLIFPKGGFYMGGVGFMRQCRRVFRSVIFIEHLEIPLVARRTSVKHFGLIPGVSLWWYKQWIIRKLKAFYSNHTADRIIAVSNAVKSSLLRQFPYTPGRIEVVHNGVDWQRLQRVEKYAAIARERLGIPVGAFVFGMITRLAVVKRIDIALRALGLLLERDPDRSIYLVIAGEGDECGPLKILAGRLGLDERVKFTGYILDVRDVLFACDSILFTSSLEGLPLGLLEGMAAGCVPVVTNVSGMPEAVDSPDLGIVVTPDSVEEVCDAMESLVGLDRERLLQMGSNAAGKVRQQFDMSTCYTRTLELCGL